MIDEVEEKAKEPLDKKLSFGAQRRKERRNALDKAQAALMLSQKLIGRSNNEIAKLFNTSPGTVKKRLSIPELQEYFMTAREVVVTKLLPLAVEVAHEKLQVDRDGDMAKEVMYGSGLLSKNVNIQGALQMEGSGAEDFDDWRRKRLIAATQAGGQTVIDVAVDAASESGPSPAPPASSSAGAGEEGV